MILLDRKKPISALKLIHTLNHTQINRACDIHENHINFLNFLKFTIGEPIYNLEAGLYRILIDDIEYIIDVYFDLSNGDFLVIKSAYDVTLYMAGSTPYHIIPYRINSIKSIESSCEIECVNDNIDAIMIIGNSNYTGTPSLETPGKIDRVAYIKLSTESEFGFDTLTIPLKHTLGRLPNGAKDFIIINTEQLIAHDIINTSKEILSGGLNWEYIEDYSSSDYYVFFAKYNNVKRNKTAGSIQCSHFESVSCNDLINKSTEKNCIAVSNDSYENGIWIKIAASVLDIHGNKNFGTEMQKWIFTQAVSMNPIYIEYETSNTIYNTILIDEYHVKTWYPKTKITVDGAYGLSVFYKTYKTEFEYDSIAGRLIDFTYDYDSVTKIYTLTGWLGTYNGEPSNKIIIPFTNGKVKI